MKSGYMKNLLVIVACIAVIFFLFGDHMPFGKENTDFAVRPGTTITGIDLMKGDNRVMIRKSGVGWVVNNTKTARKNAVLFLIKTLTDIKIKSPVAADVWREEIIDRKIEPVRVVVYEKRRPVRSFYVYETASNLYGNIMKMKVTSKPYIVYMPGYEDNIGSYFKADELFWLPFSAFSLLPSQIESVELRNTRDTSGSFQIVRAGDMFTLLRRRNAIKGSDSVRIRRYISYFTSVSFESWVTELSPGELNKVESGSPIYRIIVKTHGGKEEILTIWERFKDTAKGEKDTDRVFAQKNDGKGIFIMRYFDLDPILKKKSYFESE